MTRPAGPRPTLRRSTLRPGDALRTALLGLRYRRARAALSALGIAIGIAALVAVLGITRSSQSALLAEIDQLGTNLLTVTNGQTFDGQEAELPVAATPMIRRIAGVERAAPTAILASARVYRTDKVSPYDTGGLATRAADPSLLAVLGGTLRQGTFLNAAEGRYPVTVLGYQAARSLGIAAFGGPPPRVFIGGRWFTVAGILNPLPLAPEIDRSALVGFPVAATLLGYDGHPSRIYVRTDVNATNQVAALLGPTADPETPGDVAVSQPSAALTARLAVAQASTTLFLGLGAVALLVGGIGIANVMVIAVLERRQEIGLRRALGAARIHIAAQFLTEAILLGTLGGIAGLTAGTVITVALARARHWTPLIPPAALWAGLGVAVTVAALAGLYPAARAARLAPAEALRTT
ncbi:ABC transporter permease [Trebonia kvetii]|uniref:ABC transporter permease n=1 Tax=Trebonia kvetii TaxID=2480626 RepID=A0A6P2BWE5_9ACTN|nr:ABC transporter permease [Trebonia kvetii]TVZ03027.1 ABC transporter permease [Trebonia kvetii]